MSFSVLHATPLTAQGVFTAGAEGPACDAQGNLYAVNFARQGTIGRITPDGAGEVFVELPAGSVGNGIRADAHGRLYVADYVGHNVLTVDLATRAVSVYAHEPGLHQPNDLAITRGGVLFASDPDWSTGTGRLWRVGHDRRFVLLDEAMGTTNGLEVSPDERTLYVNETVQRTIWAFDLSPTHEISNKRKLIAFDEHLLDGMRCDVAGNLYVTRHSAGIVAVVSPAGALIGEVHLHGKECTNLTFGGPDARTVYVTCADTGQVEVFRSEHPGRLTPP